MPRRRRDVRTAGLAAVASILIVLSGPSQASAHAAAPLPPVQDLIVAGAADITSTPSPRISWNGPPTGTYDVELARADDTDPSLGAWQRRVTDGETDRTMTQPLGRGRVLCVRVRHHTATDDALWAQACVVRARNDATMVVVGPHDLVRVSGGDGQGTRLLAGGEVKVPGLAPGMRVAAVHGRGSRVSSYRDQTRFRGPDGAETPVTLGLPLQNVTMFPVDTAGTGRFFAGPGLGTPPIVGVAIVPAWMDSHSASYADHAGTTLEVWNSPTTWASFFGVTLTGSSLFLWDPPRYGNVRPRLQVSNGSVFRGRPVWYDRRVPQFAAGLRLHVPQGTATCARLRWVRDDGLKSPWSSRRCVSRPLDDSRARFSGRFRSAADPASADGRCRVMLAGSRYHLPPVRRDSLVGWLYYDLPTIDGLPPSEPGLLINGRSPSTMTGWSAAPPEPAAWWARVRTAGARAVVGMDRDASGRIVRVSGLLVIPPWAR